MKIFCITASLWFVSIVFGRQTVNEIQSLDYEPDIEPYEPLVSTERPIFKYQKNGIKLDLKIVPSSNDTITEDDFPNFPAKDIGVCILDLSLTCVQKRFHFFLDKIRRLKEITLLGNWIKLIHTKKPVQYVTERRSLNPKDGMTNIITRDIDAFFEDFALRINLPSIQGTKKKNQIDIMFDETGLVEGRGKSGKGGKGGGGKCKKMMMMMLMMMKMKMMGMMGMTAMKGMMMAGMSLMISKWMLLQKLMDAKKGGGGGGGGGGPWQGGGGGGGGGAPLKEIVLLTKTSGGGGGGGGGGGCCGGGGTPMDSYGAPPPSSSYGAPGGGYDSGGGGWGRSFNTHASASNILTRMIPQPGVTVKDKSVIADSPLPTEGASYPERRKIEAETTAYGAISPVYDQANNTSSNLTESELLHDFTKNTTEAGNRVPSPVQSQFVTLRSSYQVVPSKDMRNTPTRNNVDNPIYVNDWKNFELVKRWRATQQSSAIPNQEVERSGQDSIDGKYDIAENLQPYATLMNNRNFGFHGV